MPGTVLREYGMEKTVDLLMFKNAESAMKVISRINKKLGSIVRKK